MADIPKHVKNYVIYLYGYGYNKSQIKETLPDVSPYWIDHFVDMLEEIYGE